MKALIDLFRTLFTNEYDVRRGNNYRSISHEEEEDSYDWWFWY